MSTLNFKFSVVLSFPKPMSMTMNVVEEIRFKKPEVVGQVLADEGILGLVARNIGEPSSRWLSIELTEKSIPWVARELFQALPKKLAYEAFEAQFRVDMKEGKFQHGYLWKFWGCAQDRGDIAIRLMPNERTKFFEIVLNSKGDTIESFNEIEYR